MYLQTKEQLIHTCIGFQKAMIQKGEEYTRKVCHLAHNLVVKHDVSPPKKGQSYYIYYILTNQRTAYVRILDSKAM